MDGYRHISKESKEKLLDFLEYVNDFMKIESGEFQSMIQNSFLSYFIFPLLREQVRGEENVVWPILSTLLQSLQSKSFVDILSKLLFDPLHCTKVDFKYLDLFSMKKGKSPVFERLFDKEKHEIQEQLLEIFNKTSSFKRKMASSRTPSFTDKILLSFFNKYSDQEMKVHSMKTGRAALLADVSIEQPYQFSPLKLVNTVRKKSNQLHLQVMERVMQSSQKNQEEFFSFLFFHFFDSSLEEKKVISSSLPLTEFLFRLFTQIYMQKADFSMLFVVRFMILFRKVLEA